MKIVLLQLIGKGGTQLYLSQLASALSNTDNDVELIISKYLYEKNYFSNYHSKITYINSTPSYLKMFLKFLNPLTYYRLFNLIDNKKPDVVHLVFEDLISGIVFCLLKSRGYYLVSTEHNPSSHLGDNYLSKINQEVSKFIVRKVSDKIIVHGTNIKNTLIDQGVPESKIFVIPHGDYSYYTRWKNNLSEEKNTILFFGSIRKYKGLEYLIKSVPFIEPIIPDIKIIIAGEGDFSTYYRLITNPEKFEIHNRFINDEEVATFFERAKVVVLPYTEGSQSGIIPIAYAFKKPVIVTDVGSIAEVVEEGVTGLIVSPMSSKSIAESIIKLLRDDESRSKMGINAYEKMKISLSWDKIADKVLYVYNPNI